MQYILIADDNKSISEILSNYAKLNGFEPVLAGDGEEALALFAQVKPVMTLLDVMMPKKDGFAVCREIRKTSNAPVIMVTARTEDFDRIMGLDIGADDYVVKPFSPGEVMARVRAVLRRADACSVASQNKLEVAGLIVNLDEYSVTASGTPIQMTKKEIELLWTLASNPGKVFSRDNLLNSVWSIDYYGDDRTVDTHIKRIRSKLEAAGGYGGDILTIWGVGYKFEIK